VDADNGTGLELDAFPGIDASSVELLVEPALSYSGFDGTHTFLAPIAVYQYDPKDLSVSVSDPSLVDVIPATFDMAGQDNGRYFLLKTKKAGDATITINSRGKSVTSTIKVLSYTTAQYATGETRYRGAGVNGEPACASCHQAAGGADHSPTALSSSTDQVLRVTIRSGIKGGNTPTRVPHKWTVTDTELAGLVAFLRGLPARGYTPQ
jgi:mono/diheme cytochrome c family protein